MKIFLLLLGFLVALVDSSGAKPIIIGSKKFTESYVLGEIAKSVLERAGFEVEEHPGMGGTIILWQALSSGQIDLYPEYTGTIGEEILKSKQPLSAGEMRDALKRLGVGMSSDLGFNNTYALVMRRDEATRLGIATISDLKRHPQLKAGLTHEFLDRQDGWRPLAGRYGLTMNNVLGIDHALGYAALAKGEIDLKDAYSTDARIAGNHLVVLRDDKPYAAFGLPGGPKIVTVTAQLAVNLIDFHAAPQQVVSAPRIHTEGQEPILVTSSMRKDEAAKLRSKGRNVKTVASIGGPANAVVIDQDTGRLQAAATNGPRGVLMF